MPNLTMLTILPSYLISTSFRFAPTEPYSLIPTRTQGQQGKIELEGISFRYADNHPWLYRNLSITIKANKWTVFVASKEDLRGVALTCGGLRKLIRPTRAQIAILQY